MSINRFHLTAVLAWVIVLAVAILARLGFDAPVSVAESLGWLLAAVLPPIVVLRVFRGAPPQTVAEVLYDAESQRPRDGADRSGR